MKHDSQTYYRTTPARTGKMMAIMLGICVAGGLIFFSMWDYWISEPAPIVAIMAEKKAALKPEVEVSEAAPPTGVKHEFVMNFVESDDFRVLAFNALPGEEGSNPDIIVKSGDEVTVMVTNLGRSFHAFGVASDPNDFNSVIWESGIGSALAPLRPGEDGSVTFLAGPPGIYDYICTVPGHVLQGMQGTFIVEE